MIIPTGHHVLCEALEIVKESEGGIIIAHEDEKLSERAQQYAVIVAVGPQAWQSNVDYDEDGGMHRGKRWANPGDTVVFPMYSPAIIEDHYTGKEYLLLNDTDVKAIIKEGSNVEFEKPSFVFKTASKTASMEA